MAKTPSTQATQADRAAKRIALLCAGMVVAMVAAAYAAVPLYDLFCRVTGYGGTTNQAAQTTGVMLDRQVTVRFDASLSRGMPWSFEPSQGPMTLKIGEEGLAFYRAHNPTDKPITGTATFNVTPQKAGYYFNKIDCFCFTEQVLLPGETKDMPVTFFIDPEIADDPNLDDIQEITLSYTFFVKED